MSVGIVRLELHRAFQVIARKLQITFLPENIAKKIVRTGMSLIGTQCFHQQVLRPIQIAARGRLLGLAIFLVHRTRRRRWLGHRRTLLPERQT